MRKFFNKRVSLAITLVIFVFGVMVVTFLLIGSSVALLQYFDVISLPSPSRNKDNPLFLLFILFGLCILLGTALTAFFSKKALNPIRKVIDATHKVANGDFSVKVDLKGIGEMEELSHSFNKMTQELSTIETLRSDFINNFSHEFKTPIVSVRGFAKLLKENNLSDEKRRDYLDIIITESERLAALSTNVLTLSKYENLEIIVDKTPFRLDEQLRKAIVLMEPKWSAKEITVNVELDNVIYRGNEDLTQQIWLNLLDNAIKFSYQGGLINITLTNVNDEIQFVIQDDGPGMEDQTTSHIFDKFYQGDTSHSKVGYGLGLPLVKRIVKLCGGDITVQSELDKGSIFTVVLPSLN
ncbi:two component sensor kinase [Bacillus paranthracis]|uniref:HAMP domain-containing sensor histidine kinase n=1 Tax=Bacillaceae TaxID=186817 RepID=UPI001038A5EF|nr:MULTISPECIES: HAMP domain-containing sensor histidine kinase [Bacillaceae]MED1588387.1 HAMP domain-containing sensor histidine kinase [Bacillus pacificus]TBV84989.1 HAMP domain-containing histidine kinase [Lysinibacillus sp. OL1]UVB75812.1 HAMP domain-containing histidine kinase [Bacillus subtilis]GIX59412.1 two component sensor kinase [Bacillus paranthracis]